MIVWIQNLIRSYGPKSTAAAILLILLAILYFRWQIVKLLRNKYLWALIAMLFCFAMISGQMWNKMRRPMLYLKTKDGRKLINSAQKLQFKAESYIVAVLNATVVFGMILSIEGAGGVRRIASSGVQRARAKRKMQLLTGMFIMLSSFVVLQSLFRVKKPWYPYGFSIQYLGNVINVGLL